jgi:hypothetical protein
VRLYPSLLRTTLKPIARRSLVSRKLWLPGIAFVLASARAGETLSIFCKHPLDPYRFHSFGNLYV